MLKRRFYFVTLALFVVAISTAMAAQRAAGDAAMTIAKATEEGRPYNDALAAEEQHAARTADTLLGGSFCILFAAVVTWCTSVRRGEPGLQSVPTVLLIIAILSLLIMV